MLNERSEFSIAVVPAKAGIHSPARNMVLGQLITNEVLDPRILQAMEDVPREAFVPEGLRGAAYVDEDMEILPGRCLVAPRTFARLLALADITPSSRVLDVGCLTGYSTAVLAKLTSRVVAIDSDDSAIAKAQGLMKRLGAAHVRLHTVASPAEGYGQSAPYDVIVVEGAVEYIPEALGAQLAEGGRLVTVRHIAARPDSPCGLGRGLLVERIGGSLQYREHFDAASALLPGFERDAAFVF